MLIDGVDAVDTEIISEEAIEEILGAALGPAIGATVVLQVGAYGNGGSCNPAWLDQDNFTDILALYREGTSNQRLRG